MTIISNVIQEQWRFSLYFNSQHMPNCRKNPNESESRYVRVKRFQVSSSTLFPTITASRNQLERLRILWLKPNFYGEWQFLSWFFLSCGYFFPCVRAFLLSSIPDLHIWFSQTDEISIFLFMLKLFIWHAKQVKQKEKKTKKCNSISFWFEMKIWSTSKFIFEFQLVCFDAMCIWLCIWTKWNNFFSPKKSRIQCNITNS